MSETSVTMMASETAENKRIAHYDPKMLDRVLRKGFNVEKFWKDSYRKTYGTSQPKAKTNRRATS